MNTTGTVSYLSNIRISLTINKHLIYKEPLKSSFFKFMKKYVNAVNLMKYLYNINFFFLHTFSIYTVIIILLGSTVLISDNNTL